MKKRIIVSIILIIAAIFFLIFNNKEVEEKDNISIFFELITQEKNISFSDSQNSTIDWKVVDENNNVIVIKKEGRSVQINKVEDTDSQKIDDFFKENGFELDIYNLADGPEGSIKGYRKDKMYCVITRDCELGSDTIFKKININIACAI